MNKIANRAVMCEVLKEAAAKDRTLQPASLRYCFTTESGEETRQILEGGMAGSFTRGAFRKGVE